MPGVTHDVKLVVGAHLLEMGYPGGRNREPSHGSTHEVRPVSNVRLEKSNNPSAAKALQGQGQEMPGWFHPDRSVPAPQRSV
jgi:hypothetical protein